VVLPATPNTVIFPDGTQVLASAGCSGRQRHRSGFRSVKSDPQWRPTRAAVPADLPGLRGAGAIGRSQIGRFRGAFARARAWSRVRIACTGDMGRTGTVLAVHFFCFFFFFFFGGGEGSQFWPSPPPPPPPPPPPLRSHPTMPSVGAATYCGVPYRIRLKVLDRPFFHNAVATRPTAWRCLKGTPQANLFFEDRETVAGGVRF